LSLILHRINLRYQEYAAAQFAGKVKVFIGIKTCWGNLDRRSFPMPL
jgi:hypothetical protein